MPDFYYLINVRSGLALDVAAEGGRGGSPLIQMPMSWENLLRPAKATPADSGAAPAAART